MRTLRKLLPLMGVVLILASVGLLLLSYVRTAQAQKILEQIRQRLSQRITGYEGIYTDTDMPVLSLEGTDYVGILDLPGYGVQLPVGSVWETGKLTTHPCRFWGSAYDEPWLLAAAGTKASWIFAER